MAPQPGILYVTMAPRLSEAQFHDWYNNEHGPGRLRIPQVFKNGFRYKAIDGESPKWMAIYDVTDMNYMKEDVYTSLRKDPKQSQRERDTMSQITVVRRFYDQLSEDRKDGFQELEKVEYEGSKEAEVVMLAVLFKLKNSTPEEAEELGKWYKEEHIELLSKVKGWRRTRRFVTSAVEPASDPKDTEYLALHEYDADNGLDDSPEMKAATSTAWRSKLYSTIIASKARRTYSLYYTFGAAPRDLQSLTDPSAKRFTSTYHGTTTTPSASAPELTSVVTTPDGVPLRYTLSGSPSPSAPTLLLINSILVSPSIWTAFLTHFSRSRVGAQYRIIRFWPRGRAPLPAAAATPVTVDTLASDAQALLDALRVRTAHVAGVSLGGATALALALRHPGRVASLVACDTNAAAPPGNPAAWDARVAVAEGAGAVDEDGARVVGPALAAATAARWFAGPAEGAAFERVREDVAANSLEGFRAVVKALYAYDFRPEMAGAKVRGLFVVGAGDGALPVSMKEMARSYGSGADCVEIEGAGHLPMVEQPERFSELVEAFLGSGKAD